MFEAIIRKGTLTAVIALIICVIGIFTAFRIPVQMIPDLEVRTISVRTSWPGATPQDVEKEILIEQEEYLRAIPGMQRMIAQASSGQARIEMEFPYDIDLTQTLIRVNNALNQVPSYPENVDQPSVSATSFSQNSFMYLRVSPLPGNPRNLDMDMMRDFIDDHVRTRMESVPDVESVGIGGGAERQIQIFLDPAALADREMTVWDVRNAVRARNLDVSGGEIEGGKRRYLLRTVGRFEQLDELENLILRRDGDSIVRVRDVADVRLDHFEIRGRSRVNGQPVVTLQVRRQPGSNAIDIKYAMIEEIAAINRELLNPAGMILELTAEDAGYVESSIRNIWTNLAMGAILATLIMYAFLRSARATMVGVIGIPICTIAAFIGLMLAGRSINVISLAGVAFAIGMTLDNSIVVLESIDLERRRGMEKMQAALRGVQKVWPAVLASTFTTVLVFVPIVFIQEEAGQLYSDVAIAISASILVSMLVAITIIPTVAARIDFAKGGPKSQHKAIESLQSKIVNFVSWLLQDRRRTIVTIVATIGISGFIYLVLMPPAEYLPEGEEPKTFVRMNAPPGYNLETMVEISSEIEDYLLPFVGDDPARFSRGETQVPALKYLIVNTDAQGIFLITEAAKINQLGDVMETITAIFESYPGMRAFAARGSIISSNQGGTRAVSMDISGPRLNDVYNVAMAAYRRANEIFDHPRIQAQPPTLSLSQPLVEIRPDWERAAELGLDARQLGYTIAAMSDGAYVDEFFQQDDKIDIYFYNKDGLDTGLDELPQIPIFSPVAGIVPLGAIAEIVETVDTNVIRRINSKRTVTLNIIAPQDIPLELAVEQVKGDLIGHLRETGQLPADINIDISGASDQLDATQKAISENYVVAVIIVYLLLVAIFSHWGYPLLIMTTLPLGVAGGIVGLLLLNLVGGLLPLFGLQPIRQPFDMISMLGFIILMGTVVNNPILIVHRSMENVREQGLRIRDAVHEAVSSRLRPILMSSMTTIFGLAPLVFMPGAGTELYRGVGAIVLFGILGAAIVSLSFLPAFTTLVLGVFEKNSGATGIPTEPKIFDKAAE